VGWEYAWTNNWSFKVEYDYINYGSTNIAYPSAAAAIQSFAVKDTKQIAKVGVNYKFDWGGPVVARY
jgi:outer membrane immunogenic protein